MQYVQARPAHAALEVWCAAVGAPDWFHQSRQRFAGPAGLRRALVSLSPLLATVVLTAAVFLLPATGGEPPAGPAVDDIKVSATHMGDDVRAWRPSTLE